MKRKTKIGVLKVVLGGILVASVIGGIYWTILNQLKREDNIIPRDYKNQKIELASEAKNRTTTPETQSAKEYIKQQIISLEKNHKLVDTYNSIDISQASDEEKKWLVDTDRKKLASEMRKDLASETLRTIDDICGLDELSEKDCRFIYRIFNPIYEKMDVFKMQK